METEDLFVMEYDLTEACGYIARYDPTKARLIGELNQKCFMVTADGPCGHNGYTNRVFCVFPTFMFCYIACHGISRAYDIEGHTLGTYALRSLKLSKLCYYKDDLTSKVVSRFQLLQQECDHTEWKIQKSTETTFEIYDIQKWREQLKKDEDEFYLKKQLFDSELRSFKRDKKKLDLERELFDEAKDNIDMEREEFEKEKRHLEMELAKYKGIVENCLKEISSYDF
jgi:hypothetical protein